MIGNIIQKIILLSQEWGELNKMKGLIILDFNRTLYDPDTKTLFEGVLDFLETYSKSYVLAIIGKGDEKRIRLINELNIKHFFKYIVVKEEKEMSDFLRCMNKLGFGPKETWSIGDRIKKEIVMSNKVNIQTIWFKKGKFASEVPMGEEEKPDFTVTSFREINKIIPL